jgi:carbon-monoxide dehydrogenase small subunit
MLIASRDIVQRLPGADEKRIRVELSGNLCRCTGYLGIVNAVTSVAQQRGAASAVAPAAPAARAAAHRSFIPAEPAPVAATVGITAEAAPRKGTTRFEESFVIHRPPSVVWDAFADFPAVAACLPGAELLEHDAQSVKGKLNVRLGPINAGFAGSAAIERDDAAMSGIAKGAGSDTASRSRTRGELRYSLSPEEGGRATRVAVAVEYDLQGPLAQFSRSSLAQELGRRIVGEFAANLNARLTGEVPGRTTEAPPARSLNAGALLWATLWGRIKALLGIGR